MSSGIVDSTAASDVTGVRIQSTATFIEQYLLFLETTKIKKKRSIFKKRSVDKNVKTKCFQHIQSINFTHLACGQCDQIG